MSIDFEHARHLMIEQQIRTWEVLDQRVLETLASMRREDFVPARHRKLAFTDIALPIDHGETMMKPVVEGRLLQALDVGNDSEVLEVGTGTGFLTGCLARLGRGVTSIDIHQEFVDRAAARLREAAIGNVRMVVADALQYDPGRRFDAVAITSAVVEVPARFRDWVAPGGRLFVVRGHAPAMEAVLLTRLGEHDWREESLFETELTYLRGAGPVPRFAL